MRQAEPVGAVSERRSRLSGRVGPRAGEAGRRWRRAGCTATARHTDSVGVGGDRTTRWRDCQSTPRMQRARPSRPGPSRCLSVAAWRRGRPDEPVRASPSTGSRAAGLGPRTRTPRRRLSARPQAPRARTRTGTFSTGQRCPAADATVTRPEVSHAAFRTALLAFGGGSEWRLGRRFQGSPLFAEDGERRDDPQGGRDRHRDELLGLVHVKAPLIGAAAPEAAAHRVRTAYPPFGARDKGSPLVHLLAIARTDTDGVGSASSGSAGRISAIRRDGPRSSASASRGCRRRRRPM